MLCCFCGLGLWSHIWSWCNMSAVEIAFLYFSLARGICVLDVCKITCKTKRKIFTLIFWSFFFRPYNGACLLQVIVLKTMKDVESISKSKFLWIIEFYREGCGYCQQLVPEYEKTAKVYIDRRIFHAYMNPGTDSMYPPPLPHIHPTRVGAK